MKATSAKGAMAIAAVLLCAAVVTWFLVWSDFMQYPSRSDEEARVKFEWVFRAVEEYHRNTNRLPSGLDELERMGVSLEFLDATNGDGIYGRFNRTNIVMVDARFSEGLLIVRVVGLGLPNIDGHPTVVGEVIRTTGGSIEITIQRVIPGSERELELLTTADES